MERNLRMLWLGLGVALAMIVPCARTQVDGQLAMNPNQLGRPLLTGPNPEDDPNFPGAAGKVTIAAMGGDVTWFKHQGPVVDWHQAGDPGFGTNIPEVMVPKLPDGRPPGTADYLGFIDGEGALLEPGTKSGIWVFDGSARTLTKKYDTIDQIPEDVLAALKNRKYIYESSHDRLRLLDDVIVEANHMAEPAAAKPYEVDPNLAGDPVDTYSLTWDASRTNFTVRLPQALPMPGMYLGFNERGTWVASALGKVYVWNLTNKTLVEAVDSWWDMPLDLRNASGFLQAAIYYRQHQYRTAAMKTQSQDPNFPPMLAWFSGNILKMRWEYQGTDLNNPLVDLGNGSGHPDRYLGFDERGSWILSNYRGVYVWSYRTWRLERLASRLSNVPKAALMRLHNSDPTEIKTALGQ